MSAASPAISTTPNTTIVTLGTSPTTLADTAVLSGGYSPTGTITFTLYQGTTLVEPETAAVNGNGTYSTPTGYTLPTTGTVTGTYQWDRHLQRGHEQQRGSRRSTRPASKLTVEPGQPGDQHNAQHDHVTLGTARRP